MQESINISVIVLTYNSDYEKTLITLCQIIKQINCKIEIIVADDGSHDNCFSSIEKFFTDKGFTEFQLLKAEKNVGTVQNCYNALQHAKGKYVFCTSPGDFLHDEMVLSDMYSYAERMNASAVFGDAVFYHNNNEIIELLSIVHEPYWPELYNHSNKLIKQAAFFYGNYIVGACLLRKKDDFEIELKKILPICRYTEDNTTNAYMLAENKKINYLKRSIVYYEYGAGISTAKSKKWDEIINNELNECFKQIEEDYCDNKVMPIARKTSYHSNESSSKRFFNCLKSSFRITIVWLLMKIHHKKKTLCNLDEQKKLEKIMLD